MSLHRYVVPPPLALAVHPAPPPKAKPTEKEKEKEQEKKKEKNAKNDVKDDKGDKKADGDDKKDTPAKKEEGKIKEGDQVKEVDEKEPETPATPGSMVPEPPTPAPGAAEADADDDNYNDKAKKPANEVPQKGKEDEGEGEVKKADETKKEEKPSTNIKDLTPEPDEKPEDALFLPTEPIRLLAPAPLRPIRTKLELNPTKPYPPINTDPRGAYHNYAKAVGNEVIYIDVTKDGWLTEQWKEKSERDALNRLNGEWEKQLERDLQIQLKKNQIKELPKTAQGILLELWNVLAETNNHEMEVEEFWSRFDWTQESAKVHLLDIRRNAQDDKTDNKDEVTEKEKAADQINNDEGEAKTDEETEVEWTKSGLEEILGTVGVQCVYDTDKPLRHWTPPCAYLLLSHGFFLLRNDMHINFKPEEVAGKFEVLVTSGHDRVFGEMVKAQREREYRERKEREKKERLAKEREKKEKGEGSKEDKKDDDKSKGKEGDDKAKAGAKEKDDKPENKDNNLKLDQIDTPEPGTPTSNVKLIDGEAVVPAAGDAVALLDGKDDKAIIAVPVQDDKDGKGKEAKDENENEKNDKKHEEEAQIVPGPKAKPDQEGEKKPMNMENIAKAFKALEATQDDRDGKGKERDGKETEKVKLIWTWSERCETWRWKNYKAGLHNVGPGGWEERDWKVFADDREVWDFDDDEAVVEVEERDIHDWSL